MNDIVSINEPPGSQTVQQPPIEQPRKKKAKAPKTAPKSGKKHKKLKKHH